MNNKDRINKKWAFFLGIIANFFILLLVLFSISGYSSYFMFAAPLISGIITAYLGGDGYKSGIIGGAISTTPSAFIIAFLGFLILNLDSESQLFIGMFLHDLLILASLTLVFSIFILFGIFGGLLGIFIHRKVYS